MQASYNQLEKALEELGISSVLQLLMLFYHQFNGLCYSSMVWSKYRMNNNNKSIIK
jgi:hypothetical protein